MSLSPLSSATTPAVDSQPRAPVAALSGAQIQTARKLLNWTPDRLAQRAKVTLGIVVQAELDHGVGLVSPAAARSIRQALEGAGITFVDATAHGVRRSIAGDGRFQHR